MKEIRSNGFRHFCASLAAVLLIACMVLGMAAADSFAASSAKPAAGKNVKLVTASYDRLIVKWASTKNAKKYQLAYRKSGSGKFTMVKTADKQYIVTKLKANTAYQFKVRGINGNKYGAWSKVSKFKTVKYDTSQHTATGVNYSKASNEKKVKVRALYSVITIDVASLGKSGNGTLYSVPANEYISGDTLSGLGSIVSEGTEIGTFSMKNAVSFEIDRYTETGYDRLYDKYYIVSNGKIVKGPIYATEVSPEKEGEIRIDEPSKKGLVDELGDYSFEVASDTGSCWTALNIDFTSLILANEDENGNAYEYSSADTEQFDFNGKTYYFNKAAVERLDSRVIEYRKMGVNVVGICVSFVSSEKSAYYPRALKYIDDARWTNGFNTSTEAGRDYFVAAMEFLAKRYSSGEHGIICNYVIGNEIDYAFDWYEIEPNISKNGKALPARGSNMDLRDGETEYRSQFDTFMEEYSRTLRLANLAVKKYSDDINVGVSFSKEWTISKAESGNFKKTKKKQYDSYSPREILDWLNYFSKKSGDYDWTLTPHNYPITSCNAAAYETGLTSNKVVITGDPDTSPMITLNNLEVLQLYLNKSVNKFNGSVREVYFTENGSSSGTSAGKQPVKNQKEQAAAIAQYYYRAASLPSVKAIIYYKIKDRESEGATAYKMGLIDTKGNKKLSYNVWKYIDTNKSFSTANKYLKNISFLKNGKEYSVAKGNIKSYRDLMTIVDSKFSWKKYWNKSALTPIKVN